MKWLALLLAIPFLLLMGGLLLNRPPLFSPPGPIERLKTYLMTNVAETRPNHSFPELRTPLVPSNDETVHAAVLRAMRELGWQEIRDDREEISAVMVSPLFRFRDDVTVRLEQTDRGTLIHARSASRVGKGDLAANARHLLELFAAVAHSTEGEQRP
jgi:hypothetical protein